MMRFSLIVCCHPPQYYAPVPVVATSTHLGRTNRIVSMNKAMGACLAGTASFAKWLRPVARRKEIDGASVTSTPPFQLAYYLFLHTHASRLVIDSSVLTPHKCACMGFPSP
jgi:hypothetical protein